MKKQFSTKIYNKILTYLLDSKFLENTSVTKKKIKTFVNSNEFRLKLDNLVQNNDYSCKSILELCKDMINELNNDSPPKDWLNYIFQYTLHKSFTHAVTIELNKKLETATLFYLQILRAFSEFENNYILENKEGAFPLEFLSKKEEKSLKNPTEYRKFKKAFYDDYVYEMMKLSKEITKHNTIDHISGVHYLAMHIGRQLYQAGLPVDLGRVSGAAAGHDIGKYGCKGPELKRVPYLHYYYTDVWFKKHNIPYIGHIAVNHSTWDLELENLPLESLILIYCDFRVKNRRTETGNRQMHIFTLKEAFDIVLNKLDNVDEAKEKRYRRVYAKLKDFENYMINLGIDVTFERKHYVEQPKQHYALMQAQEVIENIKYLSVEHNIHLMHKLRSESSLSSILELARSESDWKKLRGYLNIFEEYSTYLTQKQKLITLNFLYELLIHPEEDIRKQAAELIGTLIAIFDEEYRKEVPEDVTLEPPEITSCELLNKYIQLFLYPDHKIIDIHREWIGYSLRIMIYSLFSNCEPQQRKQYRNVLLKYYEKGIDGDDKTKFYLLQAVRYIPFTSFNEESMDKLYNFIFKMLESKNTEIRLSALDRIYYLLFRIDKDCKFINQLKEYLNKDIESSDVVAENFLKFKIARKLSLSKDILIKYENFYKEDNKKMADIFLKNLKSATTWISKKIHIELLLEQVIEDPKNKGLHAAMHFCNLIKVSAIENVRNHAGEALLKIFPFLSLDQRNDVTVELLRGLEIEGYQFTQYIPKYLGQIMLFLHPIELDELIDDFSEKTKQANKQIIILLLRTIGIAIENYPKYTNFFAENEEIYNNRLSRMLGILLNGLANYDDQIKQEAFMVIGKGIFGSKELNLEQKNKIFKLIAKKILTLLTKKEENELVFLNNSASLNHIYRFISDYVFFNGNIVFNENKRIAFFPGTFDPFSLSHKEIAKEIRDLGFEVYLAVDEFSWSKKTQPHILRRNIINMSISDELNIYLFPDDLPVNIANPTNLKKLKSSFKNSEVYIVVGSDVVLNASAYRIESQEYSIHNFPHIIFTRRSSFSSEDDDKRLESALKNINKKIIKLSLPPQYEDISSTQIRNYIDENRDISKLIDPLAQKYIYEYGLYRREPQYKTLLQTNPVNIEILDDIDDIVLEEIVTTIFNGSKSIFNTLRDIKKKLSARFTILRDIDNGHILGFSAFHWIRSSMLFNEFKNNNISEYIRENAIGRIVVLDGIYINPKSAFENLEQIILTETLSFCIAKDYTYAIFKNKINSYSSKFLYEILELQGFIKLPYDANTNPVYVVDMSNPCTLNLDIETIIKEPFKSNLNVKKSIIRSRKRLQKALTKLYPGQLILSFDRNILYQTLVNKICKTNGMPPYQLKPRKLGPYMCVPFGSILKGQTVPNTVTKSMHTEKMFSPDIKSFNIGPYPYYMTLENQIRMLRSFNRSIILVDDLLNKGYRIKAIDPLLKQENIEVKKIIVGILSGRGKELMDIQNREVDSAYFIPNLKVWFNENSMYPFIGGDTVWRGTYPQRNLLPSINFVLPYTSPKFIRGTSTDALYHLSETCIKNSIDILTTLEKEYQNIHERNLTLKHLGEVFISPRCPDHGRDMEYDLNLKPSNYLKNDLEHLRRIENIIKRK
ncbi:nicotinate-nicotinamide nucleotide adenylyltransferase [Caldisalinibacter kiritimatiensis]|uniref:nicotinate-nucleotide adenylyltransferase n=1 Tax=Caldisalinibacter kiritimatiensis TaxID=1304284 RepID=R1AYP6_9FIRM|nr:hypothetical protein [Caldisalinibacter kiritimatiensis]EOD01832.1 hypothetical protein L21TH_0079 [Caldisalinibacter kiritimatiensis]